MKVLMFLAGNIPHEDIVRADISNAAAFVS
jgi:hypothetical protein